MKITVMPKASTTSSKPKERNLFFDKLLHAPLKAKLTFCTVVVLVIAIAFPIICANIGRTQGILIGTATGSYKAVTEDIPNGLKDGRTEGLSAADTDVDIVSKTLSIGKLEVLGAVIKLRDFTEIGDAYAALNLMTANAIFTIDLGEATIYFTPDKTKVVISVPEPDVTLYVDENETIRVAEWQRAFFNGSAEDGFDARLNSMQQIISNSTDAIANYDVLLDEAKNVGKERISLLLNEICGENIYIDISYREE